MAAIAVVAMRLADEHAPVAAIADAVGTLLTAGRGVVLVSPGVAAGAATLAIGATQSGRRAVPIVAHTVVDPADPAFAHPEGAHDPAPLGVLEAEAIAALVGSGFPVVVTGHVPVVPAGDSYQPVTAVLDDAAVAQRLAGDLGALTLVFLVADDAARLADLATGGEIDMDEAERQMAADSRLAAELGAAVRFLRAGGELAVITTPSHAAVATLERSGDGAPAVRIHRELARRPSDAPVLATGWC